jgi:hypothetical protein
MTMEVGSVTTELRARTIVVRQGPQGKSKAISESAFRTGTE